MNQVDSVSSPHPPQLHERTHIIVFLRNSRAARTAQSILESFPHGFAESVLLVMQQVLS